MKHRRIAFIFIAAALLALVTGMFFGLLGSFQYLLPDLLKEQIPFTKTRPMHVTLVVTWIFTAAVGGIYYYLPRLPGGKLFSIRLAQTHFILFLLTGAAILVSYFLGHFGGREYLEFPPALGIPLMLTWILFIVNFTGSVKLKIGKWPIYVWMWFTGILFFILTLAESYLWLLPWFRDNEIRDITVQWKALGAMVGSWNMLVYGSGFYVMEKISGNDKVTRSPATFFFYFLGLTNLMFNWGHHTYIVPASPWIKHISYFISMTELLILGNIIYFWRRSLGDAAKNFHRVPTRFLTTADAWIFLNLCLAILISVPGINHYTHGTHITVAHAMGATIGINSMILFASLHFIKEESQHAGLETGRKKMHLAFWITNASLLIFWISLLGAGLAKAMEKDETTAFQIVMQKLSPWFHAFTISGIVLFAGIAWIASPLLKYFAGIKKNTFW